MKCDAKINVDTVLGDKQPFCWCRKQPRASRQSQPPLLINKTAWRQQPAHFPGLHSLYPITPLPFPPSPFPFLLQTPPSASTHLTLRNPIRRTSDWMYGRTVTTKHKLQSHSPPPLSFSCSLSHLLSPSLSLLFSLHRIHPPPLLLSFRLLFLLLLTPSAVSFSSLSSFLVATALAASPYIPHFLPTLPPSSCSFLRASKLPSAHSHIALHHSSPVWENHVSYSGPGPDCMRWKWSGEWQMCLAWLDTPGSVRASRRFWFRLGVLWCCFSKDMPTAAG